MIKESTSLKPDLSGDIKCFSIKNEYISLFMRRLNIYAKIESIEAGR